MFLGQNINKTRKDLKLRFFLEITMFLGPKFTKLNRFKVVNFLFHYLIKYHIDQIDFKMTDRNRTYQNGRVSTHSDVQCGSANRQMSFSGRGNVRIKLLFSGHIANKFRRPTILQLNIEGLTASKMNVLHHLTMQSEALVILLQETHCTDAEKLVLPNYQLAGSSLSRKHGLATFVHERLRYTLLDQSPPTSEIEWLCVDVDGYKIVNIYKPPPM